MTHHSVEDAISLLRRAGLMPTQPRVTLATLALGEPVVALTCDDLCDRAMDAGISLDPGEVERGLAELRDHGVLPRSFDGVRRNKIQLNRASQILQAIGNPHRLGIVQELCDGERCAGELGRVVGLQPSALSQHLSRLKADGIIRQRRQASRIYYCLTCPQTRQILDTL